MKSSIFTVAAMAVSVFAQTLPQASDCPATPEAAEGVDLAAGVEIKPENVPQGCNDFEVLVGEFALRTSIL